MSRTTLALYSSALVASFACRGLAAELRVSDQYPTIQGAINEAAAGDTVLVAGGLYSQSFAVPRSKSGMTIKADGTGLVWCHASAAVHAADVAIEGIRFLLRGCGVYVAPGASCSLRSIHCNGQTHGIFIDNSVVRLEDVHCRDNSLAAVWITGSAANVTVTDCEFMASRPAIGLVVKESATANVTNCTITGNRHGVWSRSGASVNLTHCTLDDNWFGAVHVTGGGKVGTSICTVHGGGILVRGRDSEFIAEGGLIADCNHHAVKFLQGNGSVTGVEMKHNQQGIVIEDSSPLIEGNWIHDNRLEGITVITTRTSDVLYQDGRLTLDHEPDDSVAAPIIKGNRFADNNGVAIHVQDSQPANMHTLSTDNTFEGEDLQVKCEWTGCAFCLQDGIPSEGAHISAVNAAGDAWGPYVTGANGFMQAANGTAEPWRLMLDYVIDADGKRIDHNPWTIEAHSPAGRLCGSCVYSWNGRHKEEGFDFEGRYQVARIELNARPIADAGEDRTVIADAASGASVLLDASGCSDAEGDDLVFTWREGDTVLAGPTAEERVEVHLSPGQHRITLSADDGQGDPGEDEVILTVSPAF